MFWVIGFILIHGSLQDEIKDLMDCCPYPLSPCSIQHGCCIQLCTALDPALGLRGLSDVGSDGCCPHDDPCGDNVESGNCMLCDCDPWGEEQGDPFVFDSLRSGFGDTEESGVSGFERESGKGFDELDPNDKQPGFTGIELFGSWEETNSTKIKETTSSNTGILGLRSGFGNNDFAFDKPESPEEEEVEVEEDDELSYLIGCCPSPTAPCSVQHTCCIQLCSALEPGLRVRSALDVGSDGCCPQSDPCGENLESGNCIHCNCNYDYYDNQPQGDTLRSSFGSDIDLAEYKDYGIERESGRGFEGLQVKVGFTGNGLNREEGERFDRVNRDSGPFIADEEAQPEYNGVGQNIFRCMACFDQRD